MKIQEILYIGHDASVPFKLGTLGPHTVLPVTISCPIVFSWISSTVWNLFPFKGDFSFGESHKLQGTKSGLKGGLNHLGDLMFRKKNLCMRHDSWVVTLSWWSCQSLFTYSYSLLYQLNSFRGEVFKFNAKSDANSLLYSDILNTMATQYIHMLTQQQWPPHWLVQWSHHCSLMCFPVHSPWLPGYIDVTRTVLVILIMTGLFPDRPHRHLPICLSSSFLLFPPYLPITLLIHLSFL